MSLGEKYNVQLEKRKARDNNASGKIQGHATERWIKSEMKTEVRKIERRGWMATTQRREGPP